MNNIKVSDKIDKMLANAYYLGGIDKQKNFLEVKRENSILKSRERSIKKSCFCMGDPIWRHICAEGGSNMNKIILILALLMVILGACSARTSEGSCMDACQRAKDCFYFTSDSNNEEENK